MVRKASKLAYALVCYTYRIYSIIRQHQHVVCRIDYKQSKLRTIPDANTVYCAKINLRVRPALVVVIGKELDTYGILCLRS